MAVPKRKTSKSRTKMRQANKAYVFQLNNKCKKCYQLVRKHNVCECTL